MSTIAPSRLNDVSSASNFVALTADNFAMIAEDLAKRVPTYVSGTPTSIVGPPTSGAHVLREHWRDALLAEWLCVTAGTPGTWRQVMPAFVTSDPVGAPTGYWITRTDLAFAQKAYNGSTWDDVGTVGPTGPPGSVWYGSSGAPSGGTGVVGDWALDTAAGAGLGDVYEKTGVSTWTLRTNIKGTDGIDGSGGMVLVTQSGAPAGGTGAVGDFSVDRDTGDLYEKTGVSTWTLRAYGPKDRVVPGYVGAQRFLVDSNNVNDQTGTTYTLAATDNGKTVVFNNASAVTVTVPSGLGVGFSCLLVQKGAGQVGLTTSSTTLRNRQSHTKLAGQYAAASLISHVANEFIFGGDTST